MGWLCLILAGCFEVAFAWLLKLSNNFTRPAATIGFLVTGTISFLLLSQAMKTIPIGTAYAVWTGIGAFGTAVVGILVFKDPASTGRLFFLALLITSILGLRAVSTS